VNAAEAAQAAGVEVTDARTAAVAADGIRDAGAAVVIVTLGVDGAVVVGPAGGSRLVVPPLVGPYPVGSGDAFLGGLAVAIARGEDAVGAARLGCAAGIANAQVPGAGQLDADGVPAILDAITIEPI
jgi:fructose-1-phosphate kinase PfkB-like protein